MDSDHSQQNDSHIIKYTNEQSNQITSMQLKGSKLLLKLFLKLCLKLFLKLILKLHTGWFFNCCSFDLFHGYFQHHELMLARYFMLRRDLKSQFDEKYDSVLNFNPITIKKPDEVYALLTKAETMAHPNTCFQVRLTRLLAKTHVSACNWASMMSDGWMTRWTDVCMCKCNYVSVCLCAYRQRVW